MGKKKEQAGEPFTVPTECGTHHLVKVLLPPDVLVCPVCDWVEGGKYGPPNAEKGDPNE